MLSNAGTSAPKTSRPCALLGRWSTGLDGPYTLPERCLAYQGYYDRPIREAIQAGDRALIVVESSAGPLVGTPTDGTTVLESLVESSDRIAVVTITGRLSRLTSVGDWVTSVLTARVNDVVKDTSRDVAKPGTRIQFGEEGGEVTIDATHVTAVVPGVRPMRVGHRYLVAFWTSDRGLTASPAGRTRSLRLARCDASSNVPLGHLSTRTTFRTIGSRTLSGV